MDGATRLVWKINLKRFVAVKPVMDEDGLLPIHRYLRFLDAAMI